MVKKTNHSETFGSYIRKLRIKHDIGQRELAKKVGVAPSYLNDIEKEKRTAPKNELVKKLSIILKADLSFMYDLAGESKQSIAQDIEEFIKDNPNIASLIRTVKDSKVNSAAGIALDPIEYKINPRQTKVP